MRITAINCCSRLLQVPTQSVQVTNLVSLTWDSCKMYTVIAPVLDSLHTELDNVGKGEEVEHHYPCLVQIIVWSYSVLIHSSSRNPPNATLVLRFPWCDSPAIPVTK